jgi:mercuric ion transport protein
MHPQHMTIKEEKLATRMRRGQKLTAAGGMLGRPRSLVVLHPAAYALLRGRQRSLDWELHAARSYPTYFIVATLAFLGCGHSLVCQSGARACFDGGICARPLPNGIVKAGLILATLLVAAALGLDFLAPLFLNS